MPVIRVNQAAGECSKKPGCQAVHQPAFGKCNQIHLLKCTTLTVLHSASVNQSMACSLISPLCQFPHTFGIGGEGQGERWRSSDSPSSLMHLKFKPRPFENARKQRKTNQNKPEQTTLPNQKSTDPSIKHDGLELSHLPLPNLCFICINPWLKY
jgi:hypothetical protein